MAIVEDYFIGSTHIRIHDDCIVQTPEEVQKILDRVGQLVLRSDINKALARQRGCDDNATDGKKGDSNAGQAVKGRKFIYRKWKPLLSGVQ